MIEKIVNDINNISMKQKSKLTIFIAVVILVSIAVGVLIFIYKLGISETTDSINYVSKRDSSIVSENKPKDSSPQEEVAREDGPITIYFRYVKKMTSDGEVVYNQESTHGQFITFSDNCCYDSDASGSSVGNGVLYRTSNSKNDIYTGSSYYAKKSTYTFLNNRKTLQIKVGNTYYSYEQTEAPSGKKTCTLINYEEPDYYVPVSTYGNNSSSTHSGSSPIKKTRIVQKETMCQQCYGRGECHECSGNGWTTGFSIGETVRCAVCSQTGKCRTCRGTGKIYKQEVETYYE